MRFLRQSPVDDFQLHEPAGDRREAKLVFGLTELADQVPVSGFDLETLDSGFG
jgi:hypothetical protein